MKFTCNKNILSEAINNVSLAVSPKSTIPALEGILLNCENSSVSLTAFNLELGIIKHINVESSENGKIVLNATLLSNIINKMPSGDISFSSDEKYLTVIESGDTQFTILGFNGDDFPEIPTISEESELCLSKDLFKSTVAQTLFAVSQIEQNPIYTGTLFHVEQNKLTVVSVDGFRLAIRKETLASSLSSNFHFVVPGKTLSELQKILLKTQDQSDEEDSSQIKIRVNQKHAMFEVEGYIVLSRLLEGEFIDYNNAVPKQTKTKIKVNTKDFTNSINRASIIINDKAKSPVKSDIKDGIIEINCETTLGKVSDSISCEFSGEPIKIGFNNKYMVDALKASDSEEVYIEMNGPLSPMKVLPLEGDSFLFLVLPVRLKD